MAACVLAAAFFGCRSAQGASRGADKAVSGSDTNEGAEHFSENFSFKDAEIEWSEIHSGTVWSGNYFQKKLKIHAVKVNLRAENLSVKIFPQDESDIKKHDAKHPRAFAKDGPLLLAFNTTPFVASGIFQKSKRQPAGICINGGQLLSKPLGNYCALSLRKDENGKGIEARIFSSQNDGELLLADYAAGGFWQILRGGEIIEFKPIRDSRTACGISKDGATLFIIQVEGEFFSGSRGLTYMECAEFLRALGAEDAMEFDGGHSSVLFVAGKSYGSSAKVPALMGFSVSEGAESGFSKTGREAGAGASSSSSISK